MMLGAIAPRWLGRTTGLLAAITLVCSGAAVAQTAGASRTIPIGHWAYDLIGRLRDRGLLERLDPLAQPYTRGEVARGVADVDPDTLGAPVAEWVRRLREELADEVTGPGVDGSRPRWGYRATAGAVASTSQRLDVHRPVGGEDVWPHYGGRIWLESGPFVADVRLRGDLYFEDDPDGFDPGQRRGGRTDHAYVGVRTSFLDVTLGRWKRNWAPGGRSGLALSSNPLTYPQVELRVRAGRFTLEWFAGELDPIVDAARYLTAHRVTYTSPRFGATVGEAILYEGKSGIQLRFLNPMELLFFEHDNPPGDFEQNLVLFGQLWYRTGGVTLFAEGVLDDVDLNPIDPGVTNPVRFPARYAAQFGATLTQLADWIEVGMEYERASAFAYRTDVPGIDMFLFMNRGLGSNFADYDRLTLRSDIFTPLEGLRIGPRVSVQRQGEGDIRAPIVDAASFRGQNPIFLGVKETTYRIGVSGRYQPFRQLWIEWDAGENVVRNARHVIDADATEFEAILRIELNFAGPSRR